MAHQVTRVVHRCEDAQNTGRLGNIYFFVNCIYNIINSRLLKSLGYVDELFFSIGGNDVSKRRTIIANKLRI